MTMECKKTHRLVVALLVLAAHNVVTCSSGETQSLIKFKGSLSNATALSSWDGSSDSPCTSNLTHWAGVWCLNGNVWQLRLDGMGLGGLLDVDSLARLPFLRVLSIKGNSFGGPMPEVKKLPVLKSVLMSSNRFSGEIPDDGFDGMEVLKMVYLDGNGFTGPMSKSLANLPRLVNLSLEGNQMGGKIPDFRQMELQMVDLANNRFEGVIFRRSAHDECVQGAPFALIMRVSERHLLKRYGGIFLREVKGTSSLCIQEVITTF